MLQEGVTADYIVRDFLISFRLTSLTDEKVSCLGDIGCMIWIMIGIPEFSVPLVDAICEAHQNVCWYLKN